MPIRHLLLPEPGPRAGMVQTVPWLHRAVAVVLGAWVRKLVLRVRLTTTVQPPRSIRLRCTLDPAQETQIQPVGCPPPSTTTLASKIKCRSAAPPDTGRVWLLVGIEPASAPVQAAVPSRWRREPPRSGTSLTCRSRPTAEDIWARLLRHFVLGPRRLHWSRGPCCSASRNKYCCFPGPTGVGRAAAFYALSSGHVRLE
jgi:hypothetical protein